MLGESDRNPLDFVERDLVAGPVVELRGSRRLVAGDELGVLGEPLYSHASGCTDGGYTTEFLDMTRLRKQAA